MESVKGDTMTVIEGNYNDVVQRRSIRIGWGYIRGYAAPKYAETAAAVPSTPKQTVTASTYTFTPLTVSNGYVGKSALLLQTLLRGLGYLGADSRPLDLDGQAGTNTISALTRYQGDHGLDRDGVAGVQTWSKIIGI